MPRRHRRRIKKRVPGLATKARFMSKGLTQRRIQAVDTKVFYFKTNGVAETNTVGQYYKSFNSRELTQNPGTFPQFTTLKTVYDEFKVLAVKIRFFPAYVGIEPVGPILRGNTITWQDQRADNVLPPVGIVDVINNASSRMVGSRRPFTRSIYRAKGNDAWGTSQAPIYNDSWNGSINVFVQDATPTPVFTTAVKLWFWTQTFKVVFRGRRNE